MNMYKPGSPLRMAVIRPRLLKVAPCNTRPRLQVSVLIIWHLSPLWHQFIAHFCPAPSRCKGLLRQSQLFTHDLPSEMVQQGCYSRWTFSAFALRAVVLLGLMLLTFGWDWTSERSMLGSGRRGASEKYVVLVGIPLLEHILPLRALARELASRGHR